MAGRCISVTHEALGTVRVMKTCGMMGEVVGRAASICVERECLPRDVYRNYWPEMQELLKLPGKARRSTVTSPIEIPEDALEIASSTGPMTGLDPKKLSGIVVDNRQAEQQGSWTKGQGLKGYIGHEYVYSGSPDSRIRFPFEVAEAGEYEIRVAYLPHANRATRAPVVAEASEATLKANIDMRKPPAIDGKFVAIGTMRLKRGEKGHVMLTTHDAGGIVHADAIQLVRRK